MSTLPAALLLSSLGEQESSSLFKGGEGEGSDRQARQECMTRTVLGSEGFPSGQPHFDKSPPPRLALDGQPGQRAGEVILSPEPVSHFPPLWLVVTLR